MPTTTRFPGRHELGQNFLVDHSVIARVVDLVRHEPGPIVEWATGDGAITLELAKLGRPVHGVEVDRRRARALIRRVGPHVSIREGDILRHAPPAGAVVVCSIPFHITTPVLRHLLASSSWRYAVLIAQWEVARKRAGVGGATQMTAQWWPWVDFSLDRRIPSTAFRPRPSVDAGLFCLRRRAEPLVPRQDRAAYQAWVARVFASRGRGLADILRRNSVPGRTAAGITRSLGTRRTRLPRDMRAEHWATAYLAIPRGAGDRGGWARLDGRDRAGSPKGPRA